MSPAFLARLAVALCCATPAALFSGSSLAQSGSPAPMTPLADADPRVAEVLASLERGHSPQALALSPDGTLLAWTVRSGSASELHLLDANHPDPGTDRIVPNPDNSTACSPRAPVWSPDGSTLAFLSSCAGSAKGDSPRAAKQEQIYLWSRKGGQVRQLTHVRGELQDPTFSPDGRSLGFLFVENASRQAGALDAMKPWSGVIGEEGVEVQRVAVASIGSGEVTQSTPPNLHIFEFSWFPTGHDLAYIAAPPPGENNWWVARLYTQRLGPGAQPRLALDPATVEGPLHGLQIANPSVSPDGKRIAFIGGIMSDQGSTGGDIYVVAATGGQPRDITPDPESSPAWLEWAGRNTIRYVARKDGGNLISVLNADTGRALPDSTEIYKQSISAGGNSLSTNARGSYAFVASSFDAPPEIYLSRGANRPLVQLTHLNAGIKPVWGKSESVTWENDGFHIQGWLLYPANYDPQHRYPLIVEVHGGPSAMAGSRWGGGGGGAMFSALGYFVFMPNPRGSFGEGEKFTAANVKDFGYGDLHDILAGLDTLEKRLPIDRDREGLTGWSYGGFMTMFTVTQTTRFHAAVAGAGISDWKSYYGQNSIDQWMLPFFGKSVYDDPAVYAKSSAIEFIKNVKTPTLVLVGDRDGECPAPQSFEFWHALRAEGVPTQLVVYPNEGHRFSDPAHVRDRAQREFAWFEQHMPAGASGSATRSGTR